MKNQNWAAMGFVLGLALVINPAISEAKKKAAKPSEMDAMMAQAMKNGTPGANHQVLEPLVGNWAFTIQSWMKPEDKPMVSQGTAAHTWILGNRFLKQEVKGTWNGQPFEGMGFLGYDNVRGEYQSVWLDGMSTGMMHGSGTYDAATKTINQSGTFACPMTGQKDMWFRSEMKITDNDNSTYTSYGKDPTGKEFKTMEIVYKRVK